MRFRLQYSLLTLLVLTSVCAVVVAYVVVPWRNEKRQNEIIERLNVLQPAAVVREDRLERTGAMAIPSTASKPDPQA